MKMRNCLLAVGGALGALLISVQANATPAFARARHLECNTCHAAFPP